MQKTVTKTNGDGELIEVPNPDLYNDEGQRVKRRYKPTNITPKKKKRK